MRLIGEEKSKRNVRIQVIRYRSASEIGSQLGQLNKITPKLYGNLTINSRGAGVNQIIPFQVNCWAPGTSMASTAFNYIILKRQIEFFSLQILKTFSIVTDWYVDQQLLI